MRCPYDGHSLADLVVLRAYDLGRAEVDQFQVALGVHHEVLGLDVSADYLVIVEVFKEQDNTGRVELAVLRREETDVTHHLVEVLSTNVLLQQE